LINEKKKKTAVDIREARFISKFPFKPNNTGTRINISGISKNTFEYY